MTQTLTPLDAPAARRRLVIRGGLWSASATLLPSAGTAALSIVAARILGADALGRQSLIAYVNAALTAVLVLGLTTVSLQRLGALIGAGEDTLVDQLGSWLLKAHVAAGMVVALLLIATGLLLHQDRLAWLIIGLVAIIDAAASGIGTRTAAKDGWVQVGRMNLVAQLAGPPLGILAVLIGLGVPGIFAGDGVAAAGLLSVMALRLLPRFPRAEPRPRWWRPPVPIWRGWGMFATGAFMSQVVGRRVEFIVLALFSTDRQIALYSVAFMIVNLIAMLPGAVAQASMPLVAAAAARGELEATTRHAHQAIRLGTLLSIPLVALLAALGPLLVSIVYGHRFNEAARLVPLASAVLLVAVAGGICAQYWQGLGRVDIVIKTGLIAAVIDLGLAFALVPSFGAKGAIIANLCGQVTVAGALLAVTTRRTGRIAWPWRNLATMTAASVLGGVVAAGVVAGTTGSITGDGTAVWSVGALALGLVAGSAALCGAMMCLKVLSPEDTGWISPLLPSRAWRALSAITSYEIHPTQFGGGHHDLA